ncbi:MAG: FGGY family carbohydrate kinase, partial [Ruthenibacterium sp.]
VAEANVEYKGLKITNGNWAQQDANGWWDAAAACIQKVIRKSGIDGKEVKAIGVSGQGPCFLLVDKDGTPVYDSIIWMDRRTEPECAELTEKISPTRFYEITGNQPDALYLPSKFVWMAKKQPEAYAKAAQLVTSNGYVNYKLTGVHSYDRTQASMSLLYDVHRDCWSEEILDALQVSPSIMPPLYNPTDVIGYVQQEVAQQLGLAEGVPVIAGTIDVLAGSVEAGVISGGEAFEATGTSSSFIVMFDQTITTPYLVTAVGLKPGNCGMSGPMSTTGASYQWCRNVLHGGENESGTAYLEMDDEIARTAADPTDIVFLPYMAGERSPIWNGDARGVFFGLSLNTKLGHIYRSVMEGASFALRDNIETAKKAGVALTKVRSVGGCCNSDMWLKIKASIINMPIEIPKVSYGAPAGVALLTMPVTGEYETVQSAIDACVQVGKTVYPVAEWVDHYDKMFKVYKSVYEHTVADFSALAALK